MSSNHRVRRPCAAAAQLSLAVSLVVGGLLYGAGCSRETLIGIDVPPIGSGGTFGPGSGGTFGPGSGGTFGPGSGGTFGPGSGGTVGGASCSAVSLTPGALNGCGHLTAAAFSPGGALLAASGRDSESSNLHVWQVSDGKLLYEIPFANDITYNVKFSPDGKFLVLAGFAPVAGTGNSGAAVFDAATGALVMELPTRSGSYVSALAFSHDGTRLVTAGAQSFIDVWKVADWTALLAIATVPPESIYEVDFSPDDSRFVVSSSSGTNRIRKTSDGSVLAEIPNLYDEMNRASYSPNGQLILSVGGPGQLQILDPSAMTLQVMAFNPPSTAVNPIGKAAWIDDSRFVADDWSGKIEEWSKDPAQPTGSFSLTRTWTMPGQAWGFAVAPDGLSFIVTGDFGFQVLTP